MVREPRDTERAQGPPSTPPTTQGARAGPARLRPALWRVGEGLVLGAFLALGLGQLGLGARLGGYELLAGAFLGGGAAAATARTRRWLWPAAAAVTAALLLVAYTPIADVLVSGLLRRDEPQAAPAVVVLGSFVQKDQALSAAAQERVVRGYALLRQGYAPRLVLTRPASAAGSWERPVRGQMRELGLDYPVDVVGPAGDTHDEALAVAGLARRRGWDRVILVTHPWHMRRAAAAFERAGVRVVCVPCVEGRHDLAALGPGDRFGAFRYWLHEAVGYRLYRLRGWA